MTIQAIKPRRPAAGVTLTEVLIAMGILAIGLLGVASVFPVGGYYMQQGEIADRGSAIAQAALDDAIVRGHLNPENWVVHDVQTGTGTVDMMSFTNGIPSPVPNQVRLGVSQASTTPIPWPSNVPFRNFDPEPSRATVFGSAYVIDPLGFADALHDVSAVDLANRITSMPLRHFPGFANNPPQPWYTNPTNSPWAPWDIGNSGAFWPVRRVTITSQYRDPTLARKLFASADDLALTLPDSGDNPSRQQWETWGTNNAPSVRESRGDYSWIISVAPASSASRTAMASAPDAYPVEVSVVVFYKRTRARGLQLVTDAEKLVDAAVTSATPGGGELLLTKRGNDSGESPFEDLRPGHYVMVTGPHPLSSAARPMLALRWCRVLNLEDRNDNVLVSLRGPDWPWGESDPISQDLQVGIVPGAVAVHTKTMRLEAGSEWSVD